MIYPVEKYSKRIKAFSQLICLLFCTILIVISLAYPLPHDSMPRSITISYGIILCAILSRASFTDISGMYIERSICYLGIAIGLSVNLSLLITSDSLSSYILLEHISSSLLSLIIFKLISFLSKKVIGKESLGNGDAMLAALGGSWLGLYGNALAIAFAFVLASFYSVINRWFRKSVPFEVIPFAPFISLGIWGVWLREPIAWWRGWLSLWNI